MQSLAYVYACIAAHILTHKRAHAHTRVQVYTSAYWHTRKGQRQCQFTDGLASCSCFSNVVCNAVAADPHAPFF